MPEWKRRYEQGQKVNAAAAEERSEAESDNEPEAEPPSAASQRNDPIQPTQPDITKPVEPIYDYTGVAAETSTKAASSEKTHKKETYGQLGMFESDDSEVLGMDDDDGYEQEN